MSRLAADSGGNVLAITAVSLFPLLAMIGGAIDASRLYMANTRLQQACDAGALAGRKAMANIKTLSNEEKKKATDFFDFNFPEKTYGAGMPSRSYAKGADGVVVGTASIDMPTTIMKMFGYSTVTLSVTCESTLNIPNTDVMFVLDVTGSMDETPTGDSVNKITGLKNAVKDFYALLGPGAVSGPGRIRYGFMPYSSNVNVGSILLQLNRSYLLGGTPGDTWKYQSRKAQWVTEYVASYGSVGPQTDGSTTVGSVTWNGAWTQYGASTTKITEADCKAKVPGTSNGTWSSRNTTQQGSPADPVYPQSSQTIDYSSTQTRTPTQYKYDWTKTSGNKTNPATGTCVVYYQTGTQTQTTPSTATRPVYWTARDRFTGWNYQQNDAVDVASIVSGTGANPAYWPGYYEGSNPNIDYWYSNGTNSSATSSVMGWEGCIEEADTDDDITASSALNTPSQFGDTHYDLQIDLVPSSTATKWKPFLPGLQYERKTSRGYGNWIGRDNGDLNACPREASELKQYASDYVAAAGTTKAYSPSFNTYVNSLTPGGFTYHDIGLIWGARFLSADGIFRATNSDAASPGGYQVNRHLVFMTDGALNTPYNNSDPWGYNPLDQRLLPSTAMTTARSMESHRRRVQIICNAMKSKKFTIWVIGFGIDALPDELKACATDEAHASVAKNSGDLQAQFAKIAQAVGGLRLSS